MSVLQEEFRGVTHDGRVPLMELKASYYLSDASEEGHACTCVVPGCVATLRRRLPVYMGDSATHHSRCVSRSHLWTPQQRATWNPSTAPVVPLRVPAGTLLLWRSTMLHSVTPHQSANWRLHLMFSYVPRWFRPSYRGTFQNIVHEPGLLARCDPVRLVRMFSPASHPERARRRLTIHVHDACHRIMRCLPSVSVCPGPASDVRGDG